ncbi:MAG: Histidine kinase, gyrase and HSP90-like ATPase [Frankiales bacterium]|nr:Histidine kinase, gyrase and HSP90-like ATPase [Frankiales bacterium]
MKPAPHPAGPGSSGGALPVSSGGLSVRRQVAGAVCVVVGLPLLTLLLVHQRETLPLATPVLLVLLVVVAGALLGGLRVGLPAAVVGGLVLNWFFTVPYDTLVVDKVDQLVVLGVYLAVAVVVSLAVGLAARRTAEATRARAEAQALSSLAGGALAEVETLTGLLERIRVVFAVREVALLEHDGQSWSTVQAAVGSAPADDEETELRIDITASLALSVRGPALFGEDQRVLRSFAEAAATALEGRRLAVRAAEAAQFEAADRMRTALLAAVGHDLRTPLAGIKAAVSSLRQADMTWTAQESSELLETIEQSADRLQALVVNLLDASRLQAGVVSSMPEPITLEEVIGRALLTVADPGRVHLEIPEVLPEVLVDVGLAERVVANLLDNALRYSPAGLLVTVTGYVRGTQVACEVIDHGPGVPRHLWNQVFAPFQRLGDRRPGGVGLGLAVARGFTEAMGGTLHPDDTPGGGLTMRLLLPSVQDTS